MKKFAILAKQISQKLVILAIVVAKRAIVLFKATPKILLALRTKFVTSLTDRQIVRMKSVFQGFLAQQSKYSIYVGIVLVAMAFAGFNLVMSSEQVVSAKDDSLLTGFLFDNNGETEVVKNTVTPNLKGSSYVSFISVASAASASGLLSNKDSQDITKKKIKKTIADNKVKTAVATKNLGVEEAKNDAPKTQIYTVADGDTISGIAWKFGIDVATILTENDLYADDIIKPDMELVMLPVSGTADKVDKGETVKEIASRYDVNEAAIMKYNKLVMATDIETGQILIVPNGKREIKERPRPVVEPTTLAAVTTEETTSHDNSTNETTEQVTTPVVTPIYTQGSTSGTFPWGYCTWYVAQRRPDVSWMGNAREWFYNAQAQGRATGRVPAVGSILVTDESWWGHVSYVEAVNGDQVTIAEMNYAGYGIESRRTISNRNGVIMGYIY